MTIPIRIKNMSDDHFADVEEIQISTRGEQEHTSTYHLAPGEEYQVYVYINRFFRIVEGAKVEGKTNGV